MTHNPDQPDVSRLGSLSPIEAVGELLRWWPSFEDVADAVGRYLPEYQRPERRGIYAWSSRGIPRARQLAIIRAAEDDFGVMLTFEMIERMTADRIAEAKAKAPKLKRAKRAAA